MPDHFARIFLLSHMRALTSLAGHILGSHPRINGYFELHISYDGVSALDRQREALLEHEALKVNSRYLFDKLLHNDYRLDIDRLGQVDIRILVCLLEPTQALRSIVDLFARKGSGHPYADPVQAAAYYINRLKWLEDFCRAARQPYFYYDAERFQTASDQLLGKLTRWLALDSPLSERYQLFSQTGKARKGDSSNLIYSGKIEKSRVDYSHVHIPAELLNSACAAYRDCRASIIAAAADVDVAQVDQLSSR